MVADLTLDKLSTELIIKIFTYLDIRDLCHLKQSCRRFNEIISKWDHVMCKNAPIPYVTNQISDTFMLKCARRLSQLEKLRISTNWLSGKYFEESFFSSKKKLIPYLQLSNKYLWVSRGETIFCYKRINSLLKPIHAPHFILQGKKKVDVVNFRIKNNYLVCGLRDGSISIKNLAEENPFLKNQICHDSDVNSTDISQCGYVVVSGSRDNSLKLWNVIETHNSSKEIFQESFCSNLPDVIWKVSFSDVNENNVAVCTAGNHLRNCLFIYNLNNMTDPIELVCDSSIVKGIFDVKWDGPNVLWTCGYDSYLRQWDLRTGKCVHHYLDPFASVMYCLDYDYYNTIITGSQLHGNVTLWDSRKGKPLQMYYMQSCKNQRYNQSSPVYSLAFDADHLFTVTDRNLNYLNFSVYDAESKDYRFVLKC